MGHFYTMQFKKRQTIKSCTGLIKGTIKSLSKKSKVEGNTCRIVFDVDSNVGKQELSFTLKKEYSKSKDGKYEYVSCIGRRKYFESEPDGDFSEYENRKAIVGESNLYNFLSTWIKIDRNYEYSLFLDLKELFRGNFKEISSLIGTDEVSELIMIVSDREYDGKKFPNVSNRHFCPEYLWKDVPKNGEEFVLEAEKAYELKEKLTSLQRMALDATNKEYGILKPDQFVSASENNEVKEKVEKKPLDDIPF